MSLLEIIERNRHALNKELAGSDKNWYFSAVTYSLYKSILPILRENARGRLLDAGAGDLQFKSLLIKYAARYESFDIERRQDTVDYLGDVQDMVEVPSNTYDTIFCNQVIEHVPSPQKALNEFFRILKPGGALILAAPHLSRLHEEPNDYFRFTKYGFTYLLESAGFTDLMLSSAGGLLSFLSHQISTIILGLCWRIPLVNKVVFQLNKVFLVELVVWVDEKSDSIKKFPLNTIAIARKQ